MTFKRPEPTDWLIEIAFDARHNQLGCLQCREGCIHGTNLFTECHYTSGQGCSNCNVRQRGHACSLTGGEEPKLSRRAQEYSDQLEDLYRRKDDLIIVDYPLHDPQTDNPCRVLNMTPLELEEYLLGKRELKKGTFVDDT